MSNSPKHLYEFGNFRLDTANPGLWRGSELIGIAPKILETLILLVERRGEIVSRDELLEKVWQASFVEEGNINYTISQLRKILGDKNLIQTVPKRGYRFVGNIEAVHTESVAETLPETLPEIETPTQFEPNPASETKSSKSVANNFTNKIRWTVFAGVLTGFLILTVVAFQSGNRNSDNISDEKIADEERPEAIEALYIYTRGKMILDDRDVEKREERAIKEFQQAITLDPTLAVAHAGLAEALVLSAITSSNNKSADFYAKAKIAVEKALRLDENLAEVFLTRGLIRRNSEWNWRGSEEDYRRAVELKPNYALAHIRYAHLLSALGRQDEALAEINAAYLIDPLSEAVLASRFAVLESRGEYAEAISQAEDFLRVNPDNPQASRAYGTFLYHTGNYTKVIEIGEKILEKNPKRKHFAWLSLLAAAYRKTGQIEKSEAMLAELEDQSANDSKALYSLAMNYAETDRFDEAIAALEKCFESREERMVWLKVEPRFARLRQLPAFQNIIKKMSL